MKQRWMAAAVVVALTTAGCSGAEETAEKTVETVQSATAAVEARDYVALGDSYAAGLGAGNYLDTSCLQSRDNSYPQLWAKAAGATRLGEVVSNACSGATVSTVLGSQLGALDTGTGWVTVTVGGNDAGFVSTLQQCLLGTDQQCAAAVRTATGVIENSLPKSLDGLYSVIRDRAPNARVLVAGYPHLVAAPGKGVNCESLTDARRRTLNTASDALAKVIGERAAAHEGFTFVDVRKAFAGHEACTAQPWINGVGNDLSESFHPNASGYRAYAKALVAAIP